MAVTGSFDGGGGSGSNSNSNSGAAKPATAAAPSSTSGTSTAPSSTSNSALGASGRRLSFRRSLADAASLPPQFMETLEAKRKQLDESIHKYIAAKEREYKTFEKDLRHRAKEEVAALATAATMTSEEASSALSSSKGKRRASIENASLVGGREERDASRLMAAGAVLGRSEGSGARKTDDDGAERGTAAASRTEQGEQTDLQNTRATSSKDEPHDPEDPRWERTSSAPDALETMARASAEGLAAELTRSNSDPPAQLKAKHKRPAHMQLASRTSSSGSSADGRAATALTSAMRSPTHQRKAKRVSLAVGGEIVKPSQPVPQALDHNSSSSHSRTRSPVVAERVGEQMSNKETGAGGAGGTLLKNEEKPPMSPPLLQSPDKQPILLTGMKGDASERDLQNAVLTANANQRGSGSSSGSSSAVPKLSAVPMRPKTKIDPDGDLFDLEAEDLAPDHGDNPDEDEVEGDGSDDYDDRVERDDDHEDALLASDLEDDMVEDHTSDRPGSLKSSANHSSSPTATRISSGSATAQNTPLYTPNGGLILPSNPRRSISDPSVLQPTSTSTSTSTSATKTSSSSLPKAPPSPETPTTPTTPSSSQHPLGAGFRRPSVIRDPVYAGSGRDYAALERDAIKDDFYGSSFNRPATGKGSFTAGSLGEEFMERNAEVLGRLREMDKEGRGK